MKNFYVVSLGKFQIFETRNTPWGVRLEILLLACKYASRFTGDGVVFVVAPEYFLTKRVKVTGGKVISAPWTEKDTCSLRAGLCKISNQYPSIILAPGTITWKQSFYKSIYNFNYWKKLKNNKGKLPSLVTDEALALYYNQHHYPKSCDHRLRKNILMLSALLTGKSDFYGGSNGPVNSAQYKYTLLLKISEQTSKMLLKNQIRYLQNYRFVKNTLYVYQGGKQVFKYHKGSDFNEVDPAIYPKHVFLPVMCRPFETKGDQFHYTGVIRKTNYPFYSCKIGGSHYDFAFEICLDHDAGLLKNYVSMHSGVIHIATSKNFQFDIHFILSDYVGNKKNNFVVKNGGYVFHSSTNPQSSRCWENTAGPSDPSSVGTDVAKPLWSADLPNAAPNSMHSITGVPLTTTTVNRFFPRPSSSSQLEVDRTISGPVGESLAHFTPVPVPPPKHSKNRSALFSPRSPLKKVTLSSDSKDFSVDVTVTQLQI